MCVDNKAVPLTPYSTYAFKVAHVSISMSGREEKPFAPFLWTEYNNVGEWQEAEGGAGFHAYPLYNDALKALKAHREWLGWVKVRIIFVELQEVIQEGTDASGFPVTREAKVIVARRMRYLKWMEEK